jgi:crotonobetainyl-CoA:carnitine CoA-transferase CaiB-like acyl-CoA transferase
VSPLLDQRVQHFLAPHAGVMEKWGLGPRDLRPQLVHTRISGYGQTGPKAQLPGYASVCEASGGFRSGRLPRAGDVAALHASCASGGWAASKSGSHAVEWKVQAA